MHVHTHTYIHCHKYTHMHTFKKKEEVNIEKRVDRLIRNTKGS